ncbi:hypothetical protein AALD01_09810, partial [Oscillospiraceae bacterium 21-37]
GTSMIHHSAAGVFILCNIWYLLIYSIQPTFLPMLAILRCSKTLITQRRLNESNHHLKQIKAASISIKKCLYWRLAISPTAYKGTTTDAIILSC